MQEKVSAYIEHHALLPARGTVVVAVSGGADSLCLMHLLHCLCGTGKYYPNVTLHIAHLNHQLRGAESEREALQVEQLAEKWSLPFTGGSVDVQAEALRTHRSLEEAARVVRYRFLRDVAQGQPISIAHHQDDQVETLLLHWIRGGGIASMVGLQPRQNDIIRPLLCVTHVETVTYCAQHDLHPAEDTSNSDTHFYRNRIRHELLPLIETMNPSFRETLLRNSEVMRVDAQWIEEQVEQAWPSVLLEMRTSELVLSLSSLLILPLSIQRHLLRHATSLLHGGQSPLELRHYLLIEQLLQRPDSTRTIELDLPDGLTVKRSGTCLVFLRENNPQNEAGPAPQAPLQGIQEPIVLSVPGEVVLTGTPWLASAELIPREVVSLVRDALHRGDMRRVWQLLPTTSYTVYLDAMDIGQVLTVRTRRPGDVLRPLGMTHEKKVQDILVDKHVPRDVRDTIPLFFSADGLPLWLGGICIDERSRLTEHIQHIVCLKLLQ